MSILSSTFRVNSTRILSRVCDMLQMFPGHLKFIVELRFRRVVACFLKLPAPNPKSQIDSTRSEQGESLITTMTCTASSVGSFTMSILFLTMHSGKKMDKYPESVGSRLADRACWESPSPRNMADWVLMSSTQRYTGRSKCTPSRPAQDTPCILKSCARISCITVISTNYEHDHDIKGTDMTNIPITLCSHDCIVLVYVPWQAPRLRRKSVYRSCAVENGLEPSP